MLARLVRLFCPCLHPCPDLIKDRNLVSKHTYQHTKRTRLPCLPTLCFAVFSVSTAVRAAVVAVHFPTVSIEFKALSPRVAGVQANVASNVRSFNFDSSCKTAIELQDEALQVMNTL